MITSPSTRKRFAAAALSFALVGAACGSDGAETAIPQSGDAPPAEVAEEAGTIVDVAVGAGSFTTLVAAVTEAGLVDTLSGDGPFTVLAPTDDAFAAALDELGLTAEELLASDALADILTYHVIPGDNPAEAVIGLDGQSVATVNGAEVAISVVDGNVMINDATVVTPDVEASNGVIHVIDSVLLPPAEDAMEEEEEAMEDEAPAEDAAAEAPAEVGTIVDVAVEAGAFTTLVAAVTEAGLVDTLSGDGPFTVLAPTDEAFAAALEELGLTAEELLASPDLGAILTYHVIPGENLAEAVIGLDGQSVATVNGATVDISVVDGAVMINGATVTTADVAASNGVIHVIDTVLLPPAA